MPTQGPTDVGPILASMDQVEALHRLQEPGLAKLRWSDAELAIKTGPNFQRCHERFLASYIGRKKFFRAIHKAGLNNRDGDICPSFPFHRLPLQIEPIKKVEALPLTKELLDWTVSEVLDWLRYQKKKHPVPPLTALPWYKQHAEELVENSQAVATVFTTGTRIWYLIMGDLGDEETFLLEECDVCLPAALDTSNFLLVVPNE